MKIAAITLAALLLAVPLPAFSEEASESPYCALIKDWAPYAGIDLRPIDGRSNPVEPISTEIIEQRVASDGKNQGYYLGAVYSGPACTRQAFDNFPFFNGIGCVSSHGRLLKIPSDRGPNVLEPDTEVHVYVSPYEDPARKDYVEGSPLLALEDCQAWINAGVMNDGLAIRWKRCRSQLSDKIIIRRMVVAHKHWFAAHWKGINNTQRTLTIAHVCGSEPVLSSLGGRVGFGFDLNETLISVAHGSFAAIFDSMNGAGAYLSGDIPGTKRLAGDAAINGSPAKMVGNPLTTLCPSVVHPAVVNASGDPDPADPVYPLGPNALSGETAPVTGHVTFDTIMDTGVPAENILTYNVISGSVTIEPGSMSIKWVGNRKIQFKYTNPSYGYSSGGTGSFHVEMRVNGQQARAANSNYPLVPGNKFLDGGDIGESRSGIHGVANNGDDFVWEFQRQQ